MFSKDKETTRYFHFSIDTPTHEVSGYISGTDTLCGIIEECTETFGYGIDITIHEISEQDYNSAKEAENDAFEYDDLEDDNDLEGYDDDEDYDD